LHLLGQPNICRSSEPLHGRQHGQGRSEGLTTS
jgi:hypothetical protein